jgi:hypothetical protein
MFYSFARHRKRNNFISKPVTDEGEVLTKHEDKEQNIFSFYNSLLGNVLIERSQSICMNCIYLDLILWIWTTLLGGGSLENNWIPTF